MTKCLTCGKPWKLTQRRANPVPGQKYCSRACYDAARPKTDPATRFWSKVDKSGECWTWMAATAGPLGYGVIGITRERMVYAHRLSWEMANGPIPAGMYVLHHCDNPKCVRPEHLFLGTIKDNVADMDAKGRRRSLPPRGTANPNAKLDEAAVRLIRASSESDAALAIDLGVSTTLVRKVRLREAWAWLE